MNQKKLTAILTLILIILSSFAYAVPTDTFYSASVHSSASSQSGNLNPSGAYSTSLFTGSAGYSYPITVPPGTNGLQPGLGISYNSQSTNKRPNIIGTAWSITQSYIQRDIKYTLESTSDDTFKLILNGVENELVYVPSENRYHTKIESYLHIQKLSGGDNQNNEYWMVKSKDGTIYRFGYNQDSEQKSNQASYVSRWYLDTVIDTPNNKIYYSYQENPISGESGATYPYKIEYNNDKSRVIEFVLESSDRPDIWTVYEQGNKIKLKRRISEIKISVNSELVRKYRLDYQTIDTNTKSFLNKITIYGKDGTSTLPPTSFSYNSVNKGWQQDDSWSMPMAFSGTTDLGVRLADVNRDGYMDIIKGYKTDYRDGAPEETEVWLNTKPGWSKQNTNFPYSLATTARITICDTYYQYGVDRGFRVLDANGDGFVDLLVMPHLSVHGSIDRDISRSAYLGNGNLWNLDSSWTPPNVEPVYWDEDYDFCLRVYGNDAGARFTDLNGDGLTDIASYSILWHNKKTWINNRNGWTESTNWYLNEYPSSQTYVQRGCPRQFGIDRGVRLIDVNGDGLADKVTSRHYFIDRDDVDTDETSQYVQINNGKEFISDTSWSIPEYFTKNEMWNDICKSKLGVDQGVRFADLNGDGLIDIIKSMKGTRATYINNGNGWTQDNSWNIPVDFVDSDGKNQGVRLVDVNADGLVDVVEAKSLKRTWLNKASKSYLLTEIRNDIDGSINLNYEKSTTFDNTGDDDVSDLGFNTWVVKSIILKNGLGGSNYLSSTATYSYKNGLYNYEEKEFRGFNFVEETKADGTKIRHYFHQDDAKKGNEYRTEILDSEDNPFLKTEYTFQSQSKDNYFVTLLTEVTYYTYDGWSET